MHEDSPEEKNKTMRRVYFILGFLIILSSCNKDNEENIVYNYKYDPVEKYVIELDGLQITKHNYFVDDVLTYTTTFYDYDTIIEEIIKNAAGELFYKSSFEIGQNNYAKSSINTNYFDTILSVSESTYQYQNDFRIKSTTEYESSGTPVNTPVIKIHYEIENDNIVGSTTYVDGSYFGSKTFKYNDSQNLLDVRYLSNNITGKISENLIESANEQSGIGHTGASLSEFTYEINSDGFVTKTTEVRTPASYGGGSSMITRTIKTTVYEYVFN